MNKRFLIAAFVFVFAFQSYATAGVATRWRARRVRAASQARAYAYRQPSRTSSYNNYRSTQSSQKPWYINSEPAFRSYRTRTILEFSGYPYAFGN